MVMGKVLAGLVAGATASMDLSHRAQSAGAYFEYKTVIIPANDKRWRGGEDSADANDTYLVVADGVGGWANQGVDPGLFSRELTRLCVEQYEKDPTKNPVEYTNYACASAALKHMGTATLTTVMIKDDHTLQTTNLGDSGYALFHVNSDNTLDMYYRSKEQQFAFNFPAQCGTEGNNPASADQKTHEFNDGDIVLVFSDGFHDNVYNSGFKACIEEHIYDGILVSPSAAADCLAKKAYWLGLDQYYRSPWMRHFKEAVENNEPIPNGRPEPGYKFLGGKHDDITVTLAQIFKTDRPRMTTAETDMYFPEQKKIYTGDVPRNIYDGYKRAVVRNRD